MLTSVARYKRYIYTKFYYLVLRSKYVDVQNINFHFYTVSASAYITVHKRIIHHLPEWNSWQQRKMLSHLQNKIQISWFNLTNWLWYYYAVRESKKIELSICRVARARICKRLRCQKIDSKELIPPAYVAWRNRLFTKYLQIRAQLSRWRGVGWCGEGGMICTVMEAAKVVPCRLARQGLLKD